MRGLTRRCSRTDASVATLPLASAAERQYRWTDGDRDGRTGGTCAEWAVSTDQRPCPLLQGWLAGHPAGVINEAGRSGRAIGRDAGAEELADARVSARELILPFACRAASTRRAHARLAGNGAGLGTEVPSLLGAHADADQPARALRVALLSDREATVTEPGQGAGGIATHVGA